MRIRLAVPEVPSTMEGTQRCFTKSHARAEVPRRVFEVGRVQAANTLVEVGESQVHEHETQQEIGYRKARKASQREKVVADRVLADSRVDANRDREGPRHQNGEPRQGDRRPYPVSNYIPDQLLPRQVAAAPLERTAQVALRKAGNPLQVPDVPRLVEAQVISQLFRHALGVDPHAAGDHQVQEAVYRVTLGYLDDDECQYRNGPDGESGEKEPTGDVGEHGAPPLGANNTTRRPAFQPG